MNAHKRDRCRQVDKLKRKITDGDIHIVQTEGDRWTYILLHAYILIRKRMKKRIPTSWDRNRKVQKRDRLKQTGTGRKIIYNRRRQTQTEREKK
jgi:hypothetical protein